MNQIIRVQIIIGFWFFFISGSEKIVQLLLENGADASLRTKLNQSAEDLAAEKGKITHYCSHIITIHY